jgi:hypothetical protein
MPICFRDRRTRSKNHLILDVVRHLPDDDEFEFKARLRVGNGRLGDQNFVSRTHAWVFWNQFKTFLEELESLERSRKGSATLKSMSPGELELVIEVVDTSGHVVVRGQVGWHLQTFHENSLWTSLPFSIEFDPTELPGVLHYFRNLRACPAGRS